MYIYIFCILGLDFVFFCMCVGVSLIVCLVFFTLMRTLSMASLIIFFPLSLLPAKIASLCM